MKNVIWISAAALAGFVTAASADDTPPARIFLQESNGALVSCERLVRDNARAVSLYGNAAQVNSGERVTCVSKAKDRLRNAYETYLASSPPDEAKASAKTLYAADLALGDAIIDADERTQLDDSHEQTDVRKARSSFLISAGLANAQAQVTATSQPAQPAEEVRDATPAEIDAIKVGLKIVLKDPTSAMIEKARVKGIRYCAEVNAKNSYGGYGGAETMSGLIADTKEGILASPDLPGRTKSPYEDCKDRGIY